MVQFISSKDQLADALTKPLPPIKFRQVQLNLNVRDLPFRLRGRVENQLKIMEITEDDQQSNTIKGEDKQLNDGGKQSAKEEQNQHDWKKENRVN